MGSLLETVRSWMERDGWPCSLQEPSSLLSGATGKNGPLRLVVYCREEHGQVVVYALYAFTTPEPQRVAMAQLMARINYGMILGNFEIDLGDGEVRYKTSLDVQGVDPIADALFGHLFYGNVHTADRYRPCLEGLANGSLSLAEAIALADGKPPAAAPSPDAALIELVTFVATTASLDKGAIEAKLTVRWRQDPNADVVVALGAPTHERHVGDVAQGLVSKVELYHSPGQSRRSVMLEVRSEHRVHRSALDRAWVAPGQPPPFAGKGGLPAPGSSPESFAQWERTSYVDYAVGAGTVTVELHDDCVHALWIVRGS